MRLVVWSKLGEFKIEILQQIVDFMINWVFFRLEFIEFAPSFHSTYSFQKFWPKVNHSKKWLFYFSLYLTPLFFTSLCFVQFGCATKIIIPIFISFFKKIIEIYLNICFTQTHTVCRHTWKEEQKMLQWFGFASLNNKNDNNNDKTENICLRLHSYLSIRKLFIL